MQKAQKASPEMAEKRKGPGFGGAHKTPRGQEDKTNGNARLESPKAATSYKTSFSLDGRGREEMIKGGREKW